jgi:HPt (histidine-containing phosphotransfer) domain-containing protein
VDQLRLSAHSLKSNSLYFGATHLASLCARLEKIAIQSDWPQATLLLSEIETAFSQILPEVQKLAQGETHV